MKVVDMHVDVLGKLLVNPQASWRNAEEQPLFDVTVERLRQGGVALQIFALYITSAMLHEPDVVFKGAELYWSKVMTTPGLIPVRSKTDIEATQQSGQIGAILSLEGVDALHGRMWALELLHRLGLRLLGPTWNHANWACDGAMEPRGGGLTKAGKELIATCERLGILVDVSHLSDRGFWDVTDVSTRPVFASHSNARALLDHPRNLTDDQIKALVAVNGLIGVTFVPWFLSDAETVRIDDVLRHVEYFCALGAADHLAFGSDFDGIHRHVEGLSHPGHYPDLLEALLKRYPESIVRGFAADNAMRFFTINMP